MATALDINTIRDLVPKRSPEGHKGTFGHVFLVATSRGFTGAGKLAAEAALRSGVGLVTVGVPASLADIVAAGLLEAMSLPLPSNESDAISHRALEPALAFAENRDAVALGMGLSTHEDTRLFVEQFIKQCHVPMLVDADGLNCISDEPEILRHAKAPVVITPHPGEMARLLERSNTEVQENREGVAAEFAAEYGCTVVLKGAGTVIACADGSTFVNPTGNDGLATGGTGDVLSGLLGGLLAQNMNPVDAACLAVYVHGLAGDLAAETYTPRAMTAGDVVESLPEAWRQVEGIDAG